MLLPARSASFVNVVHSKRRWRSSCALPGVERAMRIRITHSKQGEIDGIPLNAFQVGRVYEVPSSIGTYLIVTNAVDLALEESSTLVLPLPVALPNEPNLSE